MDVRVEAEAKSTVRIKKMKKKLKFSNIQEVSLRGMSEKLFLYFFASIFNFFVLNR